tara:strand:+ start:1555 stop:3351 length:1797 start_codon:yes stop_codon:yes gene_type:complete
LKTNLVISPSDNFIKKNNEFNNLFVDRYTYDQCKTKKSTDQFFSGKLDLDYRTKNYNLSNLLFYEILECIKIELNSIFEKNFDQKFYEIIIGAWLRKFIQQFLIKYQNIIEIKKNFNIQSVSIYDTHNFNFFTSETQTIQHATINNLWNSCIYSYIISNLNLNIELNQVNTPEKNFDDNQFLSCKTTSNNKKLFVKTFQNFLIYLINLLPNNSNIFMYITGFEFFTEKKIDLMFGQMPRLYPSKFEFNYSNFNKDLRKKFNFKKFVKVNNKNHDQYFTEIFNLIIRILDKSLPLTIVEDFNNLIKFSEKLKFPKKPKAICTSYAFESNEPFKFYLAMKKFINPEIKYFVYQHGGSYITRMDNNFNNECNTCDYFITWGDKTEITKKNNIKFVNFKLLNKKYFKSDRLDKFLILTRSMGYNAVPYDRYSEGLNQMNLTVKLCMKFSDEIKKNTVIRAHSSSKNRIENKIKDLDGFKIDYSEQNYFDAINRAKLILFNHDSTGMLEMFALNKPTLCMWENGNQHQNTFVIDDYELLKKAEILFDDKDKLYEHLIKVWNEPLKWWYSDNVQNNLNKFVNLYTKIPDKNFTSNFKKMIEDKL